MIKNTSFASYLKSKSTIPMPDGIMSLSDSMFLLEQMMLDLDDFSTYTYDDIMCIDEIHPDIKYGLPSIEGILFYQIPPERFNPMMKCYQGDNVPEPQELLSEYITIIDKIKGTDGSKLLVGSKREHVVKWLTKVATGER